LKLQKFCDKNKENFISKVKMNIINKIDKDICEKEAKKGNYAVPLFKLYEIPPCFLFYWYRIKYFEIKSEWMKEIVKDMPTYKGINLTYSQEIEYICSDAYPFSSIYGQWN